MLKKKNIVWRWENKQVRLLCVFSFLLSTFVCISLVAYLIYWKYDQDKFYAFGYITDATIRVEHPLGTLGDSIGRILVFKGFGVSAFFIPIFMFFLSFRIIGIRLISLKKESIRFSILMLWGTLFFAYFFSNTPILGGIIGSQFISWLVAFVGDVGTIMFLFFSALFIIFSLYSNLVERIYTLIDYMTSTNIRVFSEIKKKTEQLVEEEEELTVDIYEEVKKEENTNSLKTLSTDTKIDNTYDNTEGNTTTNTQNISDTGQKTPPIILKSTSAEKKQEKSKDTKAEENIFSFDENKSRDIASVDRNSEKTELEAIQQANTETVSEEAEDVQTDDTLYNHRDLSMFQLPPIDLLEAYDEEKNMLDIPSLENSKEKITQTLRDHKVEITSIKATVGPTVILYEIVPAPGVKVSKIAGLGQDVALSLSAESTRIIAPMPGRGTVGIEVPNKKGNIVAMKTLMASDMFQQQNMELPLVLGRTISNDIFMYDLAKMPHLLIAGATGQGKSVGINAIITSILYTKYPSEVKFVLIDPKKVELNLYNTLERHYLAKLPDSEEAIITDNTLVINTLNSLCKEMDMRYELLKTAGVRNIKEYNTKFLNRQLNPKKGHQYLPYIVLIIDEFADLIMTAGKDIELPIARLAQLARAIGIHLIVATQRPSVKVITGLIKANFPCRIAFRVTSAIDSRTILDTMGAEQLIGRGDMLFTAGNSEYRVQCGFIDTHEVERICMYISQQQGYPSAFLLPECDETMTGRDEGGATVSDTDVDDLFVDAAKIIVENQQGSTSLLQRRMSIGYARAGKIIDQLQTAGIVGPFQGSKARDVLIKDDYELELMLKEKGII